MGAETHVINWTLKQWEQKHRIKWNLVETMGAKSQPFKNQQSTKNQLDLAKIMGVETQPFKNQNQDKINWTLLK
jgi:hypothetical protein